MDSEKIAKRLKVLAVSENGFLFDPQTGSSYTLNETAMRLLQLIKEGCREEELLNSLEEEYQVERRILELDLHDFVFQLKYLGLLGPDA